jgi:hypothetical protein
VIVVIKLRLGRCNLEGGSTTNICLDWTHVCLVGMLWRASKNKYQKDVCCEEIRLHAHNEMIVVSSVWVNVTWMKGGGVYMTTLISTRISIVMMNAMFILAWRIMKNVAMAFIRICKPSHTNRVFRILGEVGWLGRK